METETLEQIDTRTRNEKWNAWGERWGYRLASSQTLTPPRDEEGRSLFTVRGLSKSEREMFRKTVCFVRVRITSTGLHTEQGSVPLRFMRPVGSSVLKLSDVMTSIIDDACSLRRAERAASREDEAVDVATMWAECFADIAPHHAQECYEATTARVQTVRRLVGEPAWADAWHVAAIAAREEVGDGRD